MTAIQFYRLNQTGTIYVDGVQLEEGSFATAHKPGIHSSSDGTLNLQGVRIESSVRIGRIEYGWYHVSHTSPSAAYLHVKTSMWGGGSPRGNVEYIMGGFHATGYVYNARSIDSFWMFHNWSGTLYNLVLQNLGTYPFAANAYVSSDGYVVIVCNYSYSSPEYIGANFDLIQAYDGYEWRNISVLASRQTSSTTGAY